MRDNKNTASQYLKSFFILATGVLGYGLSVLAGKKDASIKSDVDPKDQLLSQHNNNFKLSTGKNTLVSDGDTFGLEPSLSEKTLLTTNDDKLELDQYNSAITRRKTEAICYPSGEEFQVNTYATNDQKEPSIASLTNGGFVVVWDSYGQDGSDSGVYAQRYNATGDTIGNEFKVSTYTTNPQTHPSIAGLLDGGFVVTWFSEGISWEVFGQRYDAMGNAAESEFRINTYTNFAQYNPSVASLIDGGFIVTWHSELQDDSSYGIFAQRYNSTGGKVGNEFQVNSWTINNQAYPSVTGLVDGGFIVTWRSLDQDGSGEGVYCQRYNVTGSIVGNEFRVNTHTNSHQTTPSVAGLTNGDFVVTWQSYIQDGNEYGIYAQRYNSTGSKIDSEFQVNTHTMDDQFAPIVTSLTNGGFVIVWQSNYQDGNLDGVYGQRYDTKGVKVGNEFQINAHIVDHQAWSTVTYLPNGEFVVAWESNGQDGYGYGVYARTSLGPAIVQNKLTVNEGQTVTLDQSMLYANKMGANDTYMSTLQFAVQNIQHGQFERTSNPGTPIASFSQQEIANSQICFVHDGGELAPSYEVSVSDGACDTPYRAAAITFSANVDDTPYIVTNQITIGKGQMVVLDGTMLNATDVDTDDATLVFSINTLQHGFFNREGSSARITKFTQQEVRDGKISFTHDNTELAPSYDVKVGDGNSDSLYDPANIDFTYKPPFPIDKWLGYIGIGVSIVGAVTAVASVILPFVCNKCKKSNNAEKEKEKFKQTLALLQIEGFFKNGTIQSTRQPSQDKKVSDIELEESEKENLVENKV